MKRILMLLMSLATVMQLASCAPWPSTGVKGEFSRALGVNLTDGHTVEEEDTHGGFLGDGDTTLILTFTGENRTALEEEIAGADGWKALPLTARRRTRRTTAGSLGGVPITSPWRFTTRGAAFSTATKWTHDEKRAGARLRPFFY